MKSILFVCTGNTCRSPMAQGICEKIAKDKNLDIKVKSAGLSTYTGLPISENAIEVCKEIGVDISGLKSTYITDIGTKEFDHIYVMSENHKVNLIYSGVDEEKISVLGEETGGISDPYGGNLAIYRDCRDELYKEINKIIKEL